MPAREPSRGKDCPKATRNPWPEEERKETKERKTRAKTEDLSMLDIVCIMTRLGCNPRRNIYMTTNNNQLRLKEAYRTRADLNKEAPTESV